VERRLAAVRANRQHADLPDSKTSSPTITKSARLRSTAKSIETCLVYSPTISNRPSWASRRRMISRSICGMSIRRTRIATADDDPADPAVGKWSMRTNLFRREN
jgi:hypothetical protein